MTIPALHGYIERRILINYTLDADLARAIVPAPFSPLLYKGRAIAGICLIRLSNIKPKGLHNGFGISSENGAHRFAVEWNENGKTKQGVYIPRRDTSSYINVFAGGRLFPGKHYKAKFNVSEQDGTYGIAFLSSDSTSLSIQATCSDTFPQTSVFANLETASSFFQNGCLGYTPAGSRFDGVKLHTYSWQVTPLTVQSVHSSYFDDENIFPKGSVIFDNALLMKNIEHEWQLLPEIR